MIDFLCLLCVDLSVASFSNKIGEIELFLAENENSLDTKHMEVVLNLMKSLRGKLMQSRSTSDDGSHKIIHHSLKFKIITITSRMFFIQHHDPVEGSSGGHFYFVRATFAIFYRTDILDQ